MRQLKILFLNVEYVFVSIYVLRSAPFDLATSRLLFSNDIMQFDLLL